MGKSKLTAYGEAVRALRAAAATFDGDGDNDAGMFCACCKEVTVRCDARVSLKKSGFRPGDGGYCAGRIARAALRAIDEARPSREDAEALHAAYGPLFRGLGIGIAEGAALAGDILDAIDAHISEAAGPRKDGAGG